MAARVDERLRQGIAAAHARRLDEARVLLQEARDAAPDDPRAWFWLGVVSPAADIAVGHLRRALALDPSYGSAREALAKLLLAEASRVASSDRATARALVEESTVLAPGIDVVWLASASLSDTHAARLDALRRAFTLVQAPATRERLRQALLHEAITAATAERRGAARQLFREVAVLAPNDSRVWRALVQLASTPAEALTAVRELIAVAPDFPEAREYLRHALIVDARAHAASGERAAARDRWQEATLLDGSDIDVWLGLAESTDDETQARHAIDMAFSIDPQDPRVLAATAHATSAASADETPALEVLDSADPWDNFALADSPFEHLSLPAVVASARVAAARPAPVVQSAVSESTEPITPAESEAAADAASRTVMVIDDSATIRKILCLTLEGAGYAVVAEADGETAIQRLATHMPDVILLDIAMPGLDGYETCKRIKGDSRTAHLPILMLSGKDALFDKVKGHMAGATEYLTKPFEAATVLAAVAGACPAPAAR